MSTAIDRPSNPKRSQRDSVSASAWYSYYAGYSAEFVRDVIKHLCLGGNDLLVDPWNGAGTTTQVADELGKRAWGADINPSVVLVAKARLLGRHVSPSEISLCEGIIDIARGGVVADEQDPLNKWFGRDGVRSVRTVERAISQLLDPRHCDGLPSSASRVSGLSPLASFFYLALFRTVRELLVPFQASNPTWLKLVVSDSDKVSPSFEDVFGRFRARVRRMAGSSESLMLPLTADSPDETSRVIDQTHGQAAARVAATREVGHGTTVTVADSTALPLADHAAAAVVSSPPYCTRIDYAVATAPELAVLGFSERQLRELRETMIGTSTVKSSAPELDFSWGPTCATLLQGVASHPSKASSTYYLRNHLQYFDGLARSFRQIDRVLRPGAPCVLVVQDSYYKELHNDLATIVAEMANALGWTQLHRHDFESRRLMVRVNRSAKAYRKSHTAVESVLVFETQS